MKSTNQIINLYSSRNRNQIIAAQRKAELLQKMRTYEAIKKDQSYEQDMQIANNVSYWRTNVEWVWVLWRYEHVSTKDILKMLEQLNKNLPGMTDERREEISLRVKQKSDWLLKNQVKQKQSKNKIERMWNDLEHFNTEVAVDCSLLVCEWLMDNKHYANIRLNRVLASVAILDKAPAEKVIAIRNEIYRKKKIWFAINEQDREEFFTDDERKEIIDL